MYSRTADIGHDGRERTRGLDAVDLGVEHKGYIAKHGDDQQDIRDWKWDATRSRRGHS